MDYNDYMDRRLENMGYYDNISKPAERISHSQVKGVRVTASWFFSLLVYAPLLVCGYVVSDTVLNHSAEMMLRIGLALLFASILYILILSLKKIAFKLKAKSNLLWLPLFLLFLAFTVGLAVYICYAPVHYIVLRMGGNKTISLIVTVCIGLYVYSRYARD